MDVLSLTLGLSNTIFGVVIFLIGIPLAKGQVPMNRIYGFRISKAFESEEHWYKINAYGGRELMQYALPLILVGIAAFYIPFEDKTVLTLVVACAPLVVLLPMYKCWLYSRGV